MFYHPGTIQSFEDLVKSSDYDVQIWTDGSANNNALGEESIHAWAVVLKFFRCGVHAGTLYNWGWGQNGTSSYAELCAIDCALRTLFYPISGNIKLYSDAEWIVKVLDFKYSAKKYIEEWSEIDKLRQQFQPGQFEPLHIRGHQGNIHNEECDRIATIVRITKGLTEGQWKHIIGI